MHKNPSRIHPLPHKIIKKIIIISTTRKKKLLNMDFVLICTFYTDITLQQSKISTLQQPND
jgi:hypothetical protein